MRTKKRTTRPQVETTAPVQQLFGRPVMVRHADSTLHTHYLSDHGEARVDALTADGKTLNEAIAHVVPGYVTPYQVAMETGRIPECIIELGIDWPCTVDDVQHKWKQIAKKHHPDKQGGDEAMFVIKRKYYEEALFILGCAGGVQ